jgi:signal transduction histidine kinase
LADELTPELVGELLSLLAHDLRNPLSALHSNVGFVGSLIDREITDAQEAIADALLSCDGLSHVIDNLEVLSHVLTGNDDFQSAPFVLATVVNDTLNRTQALAKSHEVTLELDEASSRLLERVTAHREMAAKALTALVRNSIQHAPPGSVVRVDIRVDPEKCDVQVNDDGMALAEQVMESAFTAAGQISTKGVRGGRYSRGLGLYCARVCADAAGAQISVQKGAQGGNVFSLTLKRESKQTG